MAPSGTARASSELYDTVFPIYAEACTATELRRVVGQNGGFAGHGVTYVKGLCRDKTVNYPRVRVCAPGEVDLTDPNSGLGISVEGDLTSVNWIAIEGKDLFFRGILPAGLSNPATPKLARMALEEQALEDTAEAAVKQSALAGVELKPETMAAWNPVTESKERFMAKSMIGTDLGIAMARNLACVRVPLDPKALPRIADFLNERNEHYILHGRKYRWDRLTDNCSHNISGIFGAAFIGDAIRIRAPFYRFFGNIAVPGNVMINLAELVNDTDIGPVNFAYSDHNNRSLMSDSGEIIVREGAIYEGFPATALMPDVFTPQSGFFFLELPKIDQKSEALRRFMTDPRTTDLKENLLWFRERYVEASLNPLPPAAYRIFNIPKDLWAGFPGFHKGYYDLLARKIREIDQKVKTLP